MHEVSRQPSEYPLHHELMETGAGLSRAFQAGEYSTMLPDDTTGLVASGRSALDAVPESPYGTDGELFAKDAGAEPGVRAYDNPDLDQSYSEELPHTASDRGPAEALQLIEDGWVDMLVHHQARAQGYPLDRVDDIASVTGWRMYERAGRGGSIAASGVKLTAGRLMIDDWRKTMQREDPEANLQLNVPDAVPEHTIPLIPPVPDRTHEVEMSVIAHQVLESLPERARRIVECRIIEDMSVQETAGALGISEGTVKSALSQAKASMLTKLGTMGVNAYTDL